MCQQLPAASDVNDSILISWFAICFIGHYALHISIMFSGTTSYLINFSVFK
ncbi:hypothetical protein HMPREF3212_04420 [Citrobacter freundii]|nr:hypothetical protein HMPREF3212_04420 [Citrobacter freundii]